METKDYIIFTAVFLLLGYSFYRKYVKKKNVGRQFGTDAGSGSKGSLRDQPDDYVPYSGKGKQ